MSEVKISEKSVAESLKIVPLKKSWNIRRLSELLGINQMTLYSKFKRQSHAQRPL